MPGPPTGVGIGANIVSITITTKSTKPPRMPSIFSPSEILLVCSMSAQFWRHLVEFGINHHFVL